MRNVPGPAYRVDTERLRLRCWSPRDTASLSAAISESLEHLRPWLTWTVHEPLSFDDRLTWLRTQRGHFDLGSDYSFGVFLRDEQGGEGPLVGTGLLRMAASVDEREVGYWTHAAHVRTGIGTELTAALVRIAFEIEEVDALEIRTFTHNHASAALALKLGFSGPTVDRLAYPLPDGDKVDLHVYAMSRVEYRGSLAERMPLAAYDVLDRRII